MTVGLTFLGAITTFVIGLRVIAVSFGKLFGKNLERKLAAVTPGRIGRVFSLSVIFTGLIQSSSVVTVIGVCLVNAGVLTVSDAVALTLGANVGTTVTAQLVSLSLRESISWILLVGLGALAASPASARFSSALRYSGLGLCGIGLLLTGFELLQVSLESFAGLPWFTSLLGWASNGAFASFAAGLVTTGVLQSSSVVIAAIVSMVRQGLVPFGVGLYAMLGSNVGTSFTTLFAMFGGTRAGKAAALANIIFNVLSVGLILPFLGLLAWVVVKSSPDPGRQLANAHTVFNLVTAIVVLPFVPRVATILDCLTAKFTRGRIR